MWVQEPWYDQRPMQLLNTWRRTANLPQQLFAARKASSMHTVLAPRGQLNVGSLACHVLAKSCNCAAGHMRLHNGEKGPPKPNSTTMHAVSGNSSKLCQ